MKDAGADGDASFGTYGMRGRQYTWSAGESLPELLARREEILRRHQQRSNGTPRASATRPRGKSLPKLLTMTTMGCSAQCALCKLSG
jgi:hypothetical protein